MRSSEDRIRLLAGAAIAVIYFIVLRTLPFAIASIWVVLVFWVIIAVLIVPPAARFLSEKLMGSLLGERGIQLTREYSKAKSLAAQGKFEEAIAEYRRALEDDPENVMLRLEIAEIYSGETKDFHGAISELEECLKLSLAPTQGASILYRIADIYETNLGDVGAAIAALRRIPENWPGTKFAHRALERIGATEEGMPHPE
jgi:tetratricopeptide (TPR) repeat protein